MASSRTEDRGWLYHPTFPESWSRLRLYSLATWVNGMAFRNFQFSGSGKPVVKIAEIKGGITGQTQFTDAEYDDSYAVSSGDMLFSWSGQPESSIDVFWWRGQDGWLNQHIFKVLADESRCRRDFLYYLLKYLNPNFVGIARNKQTTGLGHVTRRDLEEIEVGVPDTATQRAIAGILGAFDDKIELNRRMNETLEAIARALFKSWFVDFDPVRLKADGHPSGLPPHLDALFPDRFEDSELGEIPAGWQAVTIGDLAAANASTLSARDRLDSIEYIEISGVQSGDVNRTERHAPGTEPSRARRRLRHGDTVLSTVRPERGSYFLCLNPAADLIASTGFTVVSPGLASWAYVYCALTQPSVFDYLGRLADGGAYPAIRPDVIMNIPVAWPGSDTVANVFHNAASPLLERAAGNRTESKTLAAIRDSLLPKVVSGEIRAADADPPADER